MLWKRFTHEICLAEISTQSVEPHFANRLKQHIKIPMEFDRQKWDSVLYKAPPPDLGKDCYWFCIDIILQS